MATPAFRLSLATVTPVLGPNSSRVEPRIAGISTVSLQAYSRFKYGDSIIGRQYGRLLAERMVSAWPALLDRDVVYVASSAYKVTPTAAATLLAPFIQRAAQLARLRGSATEFVPFNIHRQHLTKGDYAQLPSNERAYAMSHMDLSVPADVDFRQKTVVVLDDIHVTGSHEKAVRQLLAGAGAAVIHFGYILHVEHGPEHPALEAHINATAVASLSDILALIRQPYFVMNARICKYVLSSSLGELEHFCREAPRPVFEQLLTFIQTDQAT